MASRPDEPDGRGPARCGTAYWLAVPEVRTKPALGEPAILSVAGPASDGRWAVSSFRVARRFARPTNRPCHPAAPNAHALPVGWLRFPVVEELRWRGRGADHRVQSSIVRPGTFSKSDAFAVSTVAPSTSAMLAIRRSIVPMRIRCFRKSSKHVWA